MRLATRMIFLLLAMALFLVVGCGKNRESARQSNKQDGAEALHVSKTSYPTNRDPFSGGGYKYFASTNLHPASQMNYGSDYSETKK